METEKLMGLTNNNNNNNKGRVAITVYILQFYVCMKNDKNLYVGVCVCLQ